MHLRATLKRYGDLIFAVVLALVLAAEAAAFGAPPAGIGSALVAGLALAPRRRLPVASFLLAVAGLLGASTLAPGLDGESLGYVAIFLIYV